MKLKTRSPNGHRSLEAEMLYKSRVFIVSTTETVIT